MLERNEKGQFLKGGNLGNQNAKGNKPNETSFKKGEHRSLATEFKKGEMSEKQWGYKNSNWKGDLATKKPKHKWVEKRLGKAKDYICSCGKRASHWSNIDHKYKRNLNDYRTLCVSCHMKWDYKYNNRGKKNKI